MFVGRLLHASCANCLVNMDRTTDVPALKAAGAVVRVKIRWFLVWMCVSVVGGNIYHTAVDSVTPCANFLVKYMIVITDEPVTSWSLVQNLSSVFQ
jgi:hypothetical protein